jgi:Sulfotransferase family
MTAVEIEEVSLEHESEALIASGLDTPKSGQRKTYFGFDLRGWAIGREGPAKAVTARHTGGEMRRAAVESARPDVAQQYPQIDCAGDSGFFMPIAALKLDPQFDVELDITLADGTHARLGSIHGRRSRLTTDFEPRIEPIGVTALGRTGSTAVTRLLAAHPEVVTYRPFEYEPRVVTYWLDLVQDLSDPAAFRRQVQPLGPLDAGWWTGARPPFPRRLVDDELQALLGGESIEELARFGQRRIERFYARAAELEGRPRASRFVEKLGPRTGAFLRELYPRAREIVLVRDFRDMVASVFAFNRQRGYPGFGRARSADDVEYVQTIVADSAEMLRDAWRTRGGEAFLLRYEDLVRSPGETVRAMLEHLELTATPDTIAAMLAALDEPKSEGHRTIRDSGQTIGRWRSDLTPEVQEACAHALGPALREFGYSA